MLTQIESVLKLIGPLLEPEVLSEFDSVVIPELEKEAQQIGSADLKIVAAALISVLQPIADAEIKKI